MTRLSVPFLQKGTTATLATADGQCTVVVTCEVVVNSINCSTWLPVSPLCVSRGVLDVYTIKYRVSTSLKKKKGWGTCKAIEMSGGEK